MLEQRPLATSSSALMLSEGAAGLSLIAGRAWPRFSAAKPDPVGAADERTRAAILSVLPRVLRGGGGVPGARAGPGAVRAVAEGRGAGARGRRGARVL